LIAINNKIRVGSRESKLAVIQSEIVIDYIKKNNKNIEVELITMTTTGDTILNSSLSKIGGKGLFVKELDKALIENKIDIAVHSLKDMPIDENDKLPIIAFSKRENPRDVLILPKNTDYIDKNKPIGSSSLRRTLQLKNIYKDLKFESIRGNVITRLDKLDSGKYSAIVLAYAGIKRLGLEERINKVFDIDEIIPSAGQGIIAVQGRYGEDYSYLKGFNDKNSQYCAEAERSFIRELNGGCSSPIAAYCEVFEDNLNIVGLYYNKYNQCVKESLTGKCNDAEKIGINLAEILKSKIISEKK